MRTRERKPIGIIWCSNRSSHSKERRNGWSFPPAVAKQIQTDSAGMSVLHLFGGQATFGTRLDIDPTTHPDVQGDAWLPPFGKDTFDVVVLDPPYFRLNQQEKNSLLAGAAWIARHRVVWFHTIWIASDRRLTLERSWFVRVGDTCHVRCLQYFLATERKLEPRRYFERGPAMKYNRWLQQPQGLPFPPHSPID
jgi:hypothetical protein